MSSPRRQKHGQRRYRPGVESLEDRIVLIAPYNPAYNLDPGTSLPLQRTDWMKTIPGNTLLSQMSIPGSHDTMTYVGNYYDYDLADSPAFDSNGNPNLWTGEYGSVNYGYNGNSQIPNSLGTYLGVVGQTQTQAWSLQDQLNNGLRAFDLRLGYTLTDTGGIYIYPNSTPPSATSFFGTLYPFNLSGNPIADMGLVHGDAMLSYTPTPFVSVVQQGSITGEFSPVKLSDVLTTVENFLHSHPSETVLLSLATNGQIAPSTSAAQSIVNILTSQDPYPNQVYTGTTTPTLDQARGKMVLSWGFPPSYTDSTYQKQDNFNVSDVGDTNFPQALDEKEGKIDANLGAAAVTPVAQATWFFNYASASSADAGQVFAGWSPDAYAFLGAWGVAPDRASEAPSSLPENHRLYNALTNIGPSRVGTILLDFPEFIDANVPSLQGPSTNLIDLIIGGNWPNIAVSTSVLHNGTSATVRVRTMQGAGQVVTLNGSTSDGTPIPGDFSSTTAVTDSSGVVTTTFTGDVSSTTFLHLGASVNTLPITNAPEAPLEVLGTPAAIATYFYDNLMVRPHTFVQDQDPVSLEVQVLDQAGKPIGANEMVTFTAPATGPTGVFFTSSGFTSTATVLTDSNGVATAPDFLTDSLPGSPPISINDLGTFKIQVTAAGLATPSFLTLTLTNTFLPDQMTLMVDQDAVLPSGSMTFTASVTATSGSAPPQGEVVFRTQNDGGAGPVYFDSQYQGSSGTRATWTFTTNATFPDFGPPGFATFVDAAFFPTGTGTGAFAPILLGQSTPQDVKIELFYSFPVTVTRRSYDSGDVQTTAVGTTFPTPLAVRVLDTNGNPYTNTHKQVRFQTPLSGPSGVWSDTGTNTTYVNIDSNGYAIAPPLVANSITGSFTVSAEFYDGFLQSVDSAPTDFTLTNSAAGTTTTTTLSTAQASVTYGTPVTFTATVTGSGGPPQGNMTFYIGTETLQGTLQSSSSTSAVYTLAMGPKGFNVGTYPQIAAVFTPSSTKFAGSRAALAGGETVTPRPITVTAVANTRNYDGTTTAAATPRITSGSLVRGASGPDQASFTEVYLDPNPGTGKTLTPSGSVNDGNGGQNYTVTFLTSNTGTINVGTLSRLATSLSTASYGTSITLTPIVLNTSGLAGTPTGTVDIVLDGTTTLAQGLPLSGSGTTATATFQTSTLPAAATPHSLKTVYHPTGLFAASSSSNLLQRINPATTRTTITSSVNPALDGQVISFTATVAASSPATAVPTGSVQFAINGTNLGTPVPLSGGTATSPTTHQSPATYTITATYLPSSNFSGSGGQFHQTVLPIDTSKMQAEVDEAAAGSGLISFQSDPGDLDEIVPAVNTIHAPSKPVTIVVDLSSGSANGITLSPPANVTLVLESSTGTLTFVGHSPALTVTSGHVLVQKGINFTNTTAAPTILVSGGSLTVRQSTITAAPGQTAVLVTGGSADLGTSAAPGGNTFLITPTSRFVVNRGANVISAIGDTFEIQSGGTTTTLDTSKLADDFRIADRIVDGRALDSGLVTFVAGQTYVTPLTGGLQRTVSAVPAGYTINVEVPSSLPDVAGLYREYTVTQPLTVAFQNGPTLQLAADDLFGTGTTTLHVTGNHVALHPGDHGSSVEVAIRGYPDGNFSPSGGLVVHGGHIEVAGALTLPALLFADAPNAHLQAGGGPTVEVGGGGTDTHLEGGRGRDILIAGPGAAHLDGRGGDDVLIGGSTAFDHNEAALASLLQEWNHTYDRKNARDDYLIRAAHLTGLLTTATVQSNGGHNHLDGGGGLDLFFAAAKDKLDGLKKGEQVVHL